MLDVTRAGDTVLHTAHPLPRGDKLLLTVQTEKLVIDGENRHAHANRLSCRVTEVLYQGESLRVFAGSPTAPRSACASRAATTRANASPNRARR